MGETSFLDLTGKTILVFGVANRKSVAWLTAQRLRSEGAKVLFSVRSEARRESLIKLLQGEEVFVCDVEEEGAVERLAAEIGPRFGPLHGIVHSIAFANYAEGFKPFHETARRDFLQAVTISAFSLVEIARAFKPFLDRDASVVTISISSHTVTAENYGYMSPIKSALDNIVRNLAKSFSADTRIRFNTVNPGLLKTSASAGIPGYLESYLYAEKMTFRKESLRTAEVADAVAFLLSPRSSAMNGQGMVLDAGMSFNYFDQELVRLAMRPEDPGASGK